VGCTGTAEGAVDVAADAAGATAFAGGAALGGAGGRITGSELLPAKGAVAQVPTQWSGGGAAKDVEAMAANVKSRSRREIRGCGVMREGQP
jgi:hypothetical protein